MRYLITCLMSNYFLKVRMKKNIFPTKCSSTKIKQSHIASNSLDSLGLGSIMLYNLSVLVKTVTLLNTLVAIHLTKIAAAAALIITIIATVVIAL